MTMYQLNNNIIL